MCKSVQGRRRQVLYTLAGRARLARCPASPVPRCNLRMAFWFGFPFWAHGQLPCPVPCICAADTVCPRVRHVIAWRGAPAAAAPGRSVTPLESHSPRRGYVLPPPGPVRASLPQQQGRRPRLHPGVHAGTTACGVPSAGAAAAVVTLDRAPHEVLPCCNIAPCACAPGALVCGGVPRTQHQQRPSLPSTSRGRGASRR